MERLTIQYDDNWVPKLLCTIDREGGIDDCEGCKNYCEYVCNENCDNCVVQQCFNHLAVYENMQEKIKQQINILKSSSDYPHNFKGQMVEDFEWVLSLLT